MASELAPSHFNRREQADSEIDLDGLRLVETEISPDKLTATPHANGGNPVRVYFFGLILAHALAH